jgi:uncharacterized protein YpiB (UPF0302 family)
MFNNDVEISKVLTELGKANSLLSSLITDDVLAQMNDEQLDKIKEALDVSDPEKLKEKALKLTKRFK